MLTMFMVRSPFAILPSVSLFPFHMLVVSVFFFFVLVGLVLSFSSYVLFSRHRFVLSYGETGVGSVLVSGLCISLVLRVLSSAAFVSKSLLDIFILLL